MRPTDKQWAALIFNAAVVLLEIVAVCLNLREGGVTVFRYYTVLSNVFAGLVSAVFVCFFLTRRGQTPLFVARLRYYATCCLTITFLVVVFILAPMLEGYTLWRLLTQGSMLYQHLLCPVLAIVSFTVFERDGRLTKRDILRSLCPTALYALVTVPLNIARVLYGPYPFLLVYEQPVWASVLWVFAIFGLAAGIAAGLYFLGVPRKRKT